MKIILTYTPHRKTYTSRFKTPLCPVSKSAATKLCTWHCMLLWNSCTEARTTYSIKHIGGFQIIIFVNDTGIKLCKLSWIPSWLNIVLEVYEIEFKTHYRSKFALLRVFINMLLAMDFSDIELLNLTNVFWL